SSRRGGPARAIGRRVPRGARAADPPRRPRARQARERYGRTALRRRPRTHRAPGDPRCAGGRDPASAPARIRRARGLDAGSARRRDPGGRLDRDCRRSGVGLRRACRDGVAPAHRAERGQLDPDDPSAAHRERAVKSPPLLAWMENRWRAEILPVLSEYITIPNQSPAFDPDWEAAGHMERAVALVVGWIRKQPVPGLVAEIVRLPGRTPLVLAEVPGTGTDTVLLYGHLDKQPAMDGWLAGLGPWTPVVRDGCLYGRGGADDGYAAFAAVTALAALAEEAIPHARCVLLIEASEESGSPDLPHYVEALADRIGTPSLVVCLDSGCGDYDRLWL